MAKMAKNRPRTIIRLSKPASAPKANQFLKHYFAIERPHTTHLLLSKGVVDFLLGLIIGILAGLIIAVMVVQA